MPPSVQNTVVTVNGRAEGYRAEYQCVDGHIYDDGMESKYAVCKQLTWVGAPKPCEGDVYICKFSYKV